MLPSFGNLILFAKFKINQNEIAKNLCVQKTVSNNGCQGHCQLRKSLKKLEDNERKRDNLLKEKLELIYIKPLVFTDLNQNFTSFSSQSSLFHLTEKENSISISNFRPPSSFI